MRLRLFLYCILAASCIAGCSNRPDPTQDFQIGLDGENYLWQPGPTAAYISIYEMGYAPSSNWITLVFPQQSPSPVTTKGLFVRFNTSAAQTGQELRFDNTTTGLEITYSPNFPIKAGESRVNEFSNLSGDGFAIVRFDTCENKLYGALKGTIKYARLCGYFFVLESGERIKPRQPVVIELYNWPFDVRMERSNFYQ
jgi:hypothetical protein